MIETAITLLWGGIATCGVGDIIVRWNDITVQAKKTRTENRKISDRTKELYRDKDFCKEMAEYEKEYTKRLIEKNREIMGG